MNKILSLLGFAAKAGKLAYGFEAAVSAIKLKKSSLVIIAEDISPKSRKEAVFFADKMKLKHIILEGISMKDVSLSVGRKCGIISVNDNGFADAILKAYNKTQTEGGFANDQ